MTQSERRLNSLLDFASVCSANELRARIGSPFRTHDSVLKGLLILARNLFAGGVESRLIVF
jgi:hypothetical protein